MFFSVITKNWIWEILTKDLVAFKIWDEVKDEKCLNYGCSLKKKFLRGGGSRKTNRQGGLPKTGGLDSLQIWEGAWHKKRGERFIPNAHYTSCM